MINSRYFCVLLIAAAFSLHADDSEMNEQPFSEEKSAPAETDAEAPKTAENIDLKEVVDEPLVLSTDDSMADESAPETSAAKQNALGDDYDLGELDVFEFSGAVEFPVDDSDPNEEKSGILGKLATELADDESASKPQEPLVLLGNEVLPGTSTRLGWSPSESFMGISAPTAVLVLNGVTRGPTLCLTAAVHGDELNGIEIVRRVLYDIDPQKLSGALIGVPIVNLQGFRRSSRYLPDRRDLNRFFPGNPEGSSASRIAYSFFNQVITHCDMLIDLHTGSFRRTNLPQLRADLSYPGVAKLSEKMGAIVVVRSTGAPGSLRRAAVEYGIPAVTLEAGAPHELKKTAVDHGVKSIESAMDAMGMIKRRRFWERPEEPVYYQSTWVRSRDGGILFSEVELGAKVRKGDVLGTVTDPITNERSEIQAPFAGRVIGMALNQVMFPGFAAYHLGLQSSIEGAVENPPEIASSEQATDASGVSDTDALAEDLEPDAAGAETLETDIDAQLAEPIEDSE